MIYEIIGWIGTVLILIAYFLVSTKRLSANSKNYQMLNLIGALGIVINSAIHRAIPSAGLNIAWMLIALHSLYKIIK